MDSAPETQAPPPEEGVEDASDVLSRDAGPWLKRIEQAEAVFEPWQECCDNVGKLYADLARLRGATRTDREFQMFYANLEVLKQSIYSRAPQPVVVPRFKDRKPVPRKTSELLERSLVASFDREKVHGTLKLVRDDLALFSRGVAWCRYEALEKAGEIDERARVEWVPRRDFLHEPMRAWEEVGWVARRAWLTLDAGRKRFGDAWKNIQYVNAKDTPEDYHVDRKACVWEIWHRHANVVVWVHPHCKDEVLDIRPVDGGPDSPPQLEGFFPCPKPAFGAIEPESLIPVPEFLFYKDQVEEINELTARISTLSESLRLQCFYPAGAEDIGSAIEAAIDQVNSGENRRTFVPISVGGMGQAKMDDIIWTLPVRDVAETIVQLVALRKQLIDDVYQISGISDIMRGDTAASETLGAQQLKSQYGSIRIKDRQMEMVRVADGVLTITGEIMAEVMSPATLIAMAQMEDLPPQEALMPEMQQLAMQKHTLTMQAQQAAQDPQMQQQAQANPEQAQEAIQGVQKQIGELDARMKELMETVTVEKVIGLLRSQRLRPFVLQIATDSTIQPDENAEKQSRTEFLQVLGGLLGQLGPMVAQTPESAGFAGDTLKFGLAPFRAGREMEGSIDEFVEQMKERAKQPPPPNPEQVKAEAEAKALEQDMAAKAAELEDHKADRQAKLQQTGAEAAAKQQDRNDEIRLRTLEANARLAEIDRKAAADAAAQAHAERMALGQERLMELQIELAELKLVTEREKPKPVANGNGEARPQ